jgi:hypothetical protein
LLLITIVAPPVLPPGLGLGKVERSPSPHAVIVNKHTASEYAAPRINGMLPDAVSCLQGEPEGGGGLAQ